MQRDGRNSRRAHLHGLCLMLAEDWAYTASLKPSEKEKRTSQVLKDFVRCETCRRAFMVDYLEDTAPEGRFPLQRCVNSNMTRAQLCSSKTACAVTTMIARTAVHKALICNPSFRDRCFIHHHLLV
jgi:hypothetical protein